MFNRYLQFRTVLGAGGVFLDGEGVYNNKELTIEQGIKAINQFAYLERSNNEGSV